MGSLEMVRASAGSGKTTDLCHTVVEALAGGLDPARIIATTFTKKAASELKARILTTLAQKGVLEGDKGRWLRDRMELGAIGTVHHVANVLLSRFALRMGISPTLAILDEQNAWAHLNEIATPPEDQATPELTRLARKLGIPDLQRIQLQLFNQKRSNQIGHEALQDHLAKSAIRLAQLLGSESPYQDPDPPSTLAQLIDDFLTKVLKTGCSTDVTNKAIESLKKIRASDLQEWSKHIEAGSKSAGKRKGADTLLDPLRLHATNIERHPGLHQDILDFCGLLARQTCLLEDRFQAYKKERGLLDFTDLEVHLLDLLWRPEMEEELRREFDLVMVDEFQDTNPIQLGIFQKLREFATRSRWVGDPKQAIFGFRDTDPKLLEALWTKEGSEHSIQRVTLAHNYRSQKGIVQFVNQVFEPVFGPDSCQTPVHPPIPLGIERWFLESANNTENADCLISGIRALVAEGWNYRDIAILERTNDQIETLATRLDRAGIPNFADRPGLLGTREGTVVLAGLRLLLDRRDSLAAATLLHFLEEVPADGAPPWFEQRLRETLSPPTESEGAHVPFSNHPLFLELTKCDQRNLTPALAVQKVIEALDLPGRIPSWGEPTIRFANLDRLLVIAEEFETQSTETSSVPTLPALVLHLETMHKGGEDHFPMPRGQNAITLSTYHKAKGLEWPVVILSGLGHSHEPFLWRPITKGGDPLADNPLEGRFISYWVWPFGNIEGPFERRRKGGPIENAVQVAPESVEIVENETEEAIRLLYVGFTRAQKKLILAHKKSDSQTKESGKGYTWLSKLARVDELMSPSSPEGEYPFPSIETTYRIRKCKPFDFEAGDTQNERVNAKGSTWLRPIKKVTPAQIPRFHSPSEAAPSKEPYSWTIQEVGNHRIFPKEDHKDNYRDFGKALHGFLAAMPSLQTASQEVKIKVAEKHLAAFKVQTYLGAHQMVQLGDRFFGFLKETYPGARLQTEVPVTSSRDQGGYWQGIMDLVLELPSGNLILLDHKSGLSPRKDHAAKASEYASQLLAYREILTKAGKTVEAMGIHLSLEGVIAFLVG